MNIKKITLENLEHSSEQEVFDFIAHHLLTQKKKSQFMDLPDTGCMYRSPEGLACAAGCLLTDEQAKIADNQETGTSWVDIVYAGIVPDSHQNLIVSLQSIHDHRSVDAWADELIKLAAVGNLDAAIVESFKKG